MSGELLGHLRMHTRPCEVRDECMPQGVEIEYAAGIVPVVKKRTLFPPFCLVQGVLCSLDPAAAGIGKVSLDYLRQVVPLRHVEDRLRSIRAPAFFMPSGKQGRCRGSQREYVVPAILAVRGQDRDRGRIGLKGERAPRQRPKLRRSQAGFHGEAIKHRPFWAGHAVPDSSIPRRFEERPQFVLGKRTAVVASIGARIQK
jgi:hypothetical protein